MGVLVKKTTLIILGCLTVIIFLCLSFIFDKIIRHNLLMPPFIELEKQFAKQDMVRCVRAIEREVYHLSLLNSDWAEWDDMYDFVEEYDESFAESNLEMETLVDIDLDLVFIISTSGQIIVNKVYDREAEKQISLPSFSAKLFKNTHPFMEVLKKGTVKSSGIVITEKGPMMVAANKILTSSGEGPSRGILVMGRFFKSETISDLSEQTQVNFTVSTPSFSAYTKAEINEISQLGGRLTVAPLSSIIVVDSVLRDLFDTPALHISAVIPRPIFKQGVASSRFASYSIIFSFISLCLMAFMFFVFYRSRRDLQQNKIEGIVEKKTRSLSTVSMQLQALTEASTEGLSLFEDGHCLIMNKKMQDMFGFNENDFLNRPGYELVVEEERERIKDIVANNREGLYETIGLRKDNSTFPLLVHGKSILFDNQSIRAVSLLDLTKKKQEDAQRQLLEDKLQRSLKMESIGLMAGGVAHDLNNVLSGIVTYPELLLLSLDKDSELRKPLEQIRNSGQKAADIVSDLLTVARGIAMVFSPVNINKLIEAYLCSTEFASLRAMHPGLDIVTELDENLLKIAGSETHISKVIMNLITNSAEAVGNHGSISVSTTTQEINDKRNGLELGQYIIVSVFDNGQGIKPRDLDRIFEPFYSRKVQGRSGTGLGLAIVWNTMLDHKGKVTVSSDEQGTTFTLYFPVSDQHGLAVPEEVDINTIKGNNESILIVDDNAQQLDIAKQILVALNYIVYTVDSGEKALDFLNDHQVDLVVLDMVMEPGMSGYETYLKAIELYPNQRALIASGFSVSKEVEQAKELGVSVFIRKPYSIAQIGSAIKIILSEE